MEVTRNVLEPVAGFSRDIGLMLSGLENVRQQTIDLLADMTRDELSMRIFPGINQIGGLTLHLGECEYWWIQAGINGRPMTEDDVKFAHLYDTTETDFALKGYKAADCIAFLARIHQCTVDTLSTFTDDDLDRVIVFKEHPTPREGSLRWVIHNMTAHEANHKGQIAMIKRLIREKAEAT